MIDGGVGEERAMLGGRGGGVGLFRKCVSSSSFQKENQVLYGA